MKCHPATFGESVEHLVDPSGAPIAVLPVRCATFVGTPGPLVGVGVVVVVVVVVVIVVVGMTVMLGTRAPLVMAFAHPFEERFALRFGAEPWAAEASTAEAGAAAAFAVATKWKLGGDVLDSGGTFGEGVQDLPGAA
ncbi:MAG: hypothetical protein ABI130_05415, partial [Leifsonia sp.]